MNTSMNLGKEFELRLLARLLKNNREFRKQWGIFCPIVDDNGIDCVVRMVSGDYIELQIKARATKKLFTIGKFTPRPNYFFVFFCDNNQNNDYDCYIIPSCVVKDQMKGGPHFRITSDMEHYKQTNFDNLEKMCPKANRQQVFCMNKKTPTSDVFCPWWTHRDSNPGPTD